MELIKDQSKSGQFEDNIFSAALSWIEKHGGEHAENFIDNIDISKCSKNVLRLANDDRYQKWLWSASLQNKLFQASLCAENDKSWKDDAEFFKSTANMQKNMIK